MQVDFWAVTDDGKERDHNEDNFLVDKSLNLFIVADGMGGHAAGEVASAQCVKAIRESLLQNRDIIDSYNQGNDQLRDDILRLLEHSVQAACSAIYEQAQQEPEKRGMGTTCSLLLLCGNRGFLAHVGDSRIYLCRNKQVHQLSEDHSLINELIRQGKVTEETIDDSPYKDLKNAVTRAVGVYESVQVDTLDFDILPTDEFLLCSDGLHFYLDKDEKIINLLDQNEVKQATQNLVDFANEGGGHDNITALVVRVIESSQTDERSKDITLKIQVLNNMPLFKYLHYKEIVRLINITTVRDFEDGNPIINEGDQAEELFIILDGTVRLHKADAFITHLKRGDHFGEMALVDSSPRSASATAEGQARALVLSRKDFYKIIRREDKLSTKILWSVVQVLVKRLRKTTADLSGARLEASLPDLTEDLEFDDPLTNP